ncbi:MAG: LemA family protein [Paludibacteraceae bacterium]|jgi:LemA protein|nr:LemA family protein [Paludibacteraceae bacterium]HOH95603.1 LemA family protein [Candidatus Enterocola sp.]
MKNKGLWIIIAVVAAIVVWIFSSYNGMITMEESVNSAWSQVENQYQRRMDLVPNLVNTVKGYAAHEEGTLTAVVEARAKATNLTVDINDAESLAKYQESQGELSKAMSRLMMITENYPDLKANQNFLQLQAQLEGTENRISTERKRFNEAVQSFNTKIRRFPNSLIAGIFGFAQKPYFEADQAASVAPTVNF